MLFNRSGTNTTNGMELMVHHGKVSNSNIIICLYCCLVYRCFNDYCNADEVMSIADALVANGMKDLGYTYVNLDGA